jgi:peptidoglycan/LPS O-acetylase OafA/YrhL
MATQAQFLLACKISSALACNAMNRFISIYLDLARFLAAVTVFFVHASYDRFTSNLPFIWRFKDFGNDAVMVFFVLSGFVIAYVVDQKEKTLKDYAVSRFARLYSVVVPALILTFVLDQIGSHIAFNVYDGWWFQGDNPLWRFASNLFFVNELWFTSIRPFSNGPFWSLGYEFWYYVIFAVACYIKRPAKFFVIGAVCLFIGPKILLLLPVWLLGVQVYYVIKKKMVAEPLGWVLFVGSALLYIIFRQGGYPDALYNYMVGGLGIVYMQDYLRWSQEFLSSYIIGILVAMHFIGAAVVAPRFSRILGMCEKPIRYLAGYTFALYLFHYPLLQFLGAVTRNVEESLRNMIVIFGALGVIWVLGTVTERRKADWRRWILILFDAFSRRQVRKSKIH